MKKEYLIVDEAGLHARPVSMLVQKASTYENNINIIYNGKKVTLKSIMFVMSLGIPQGAKIEIEVENDSGDILASLEEILVEANII